MKIYDSFFREGIDIRPEDEAKLREILKDKPWGRDFQGIFVYDPQTVIKGDSKRAVYGSNIAIHKADGLILTQFSVSQPIFRGIFNRRGGYISGYNSDQLVALAQELRAAPVRPRYLLTRPHLPPERMAEIPLRLLFGLSNELCRETELGAVVAGARLTASGLKQLYNFFTARNLIMDGILTGDCGYLSAERTDHLLTDVNEQILREPESSAYEVQHPEGQHTEGQHLEDQHPEDQHTEDEHSEDEHEHSEDEHPLNSPRP